MTDSIYKEAISKYGIEAQIEKTIEECEELICELSWWLNGKKDKFSIVGELADVEIMSAQMRIIFGNMEIESMKTKKLNRLQERMNQ